MPSIFFDALEETVLFKTLNQQERKIDIMAERLCQVVLLQRQPFKVTGERLKFHLADTKIKSESDLLVIELDSRIVVLVFEDKHNNKYKGQRGLFQIAGEMVGSCLFNMALIAKEEGTADENQAEDTEMFGVRIRSDEVTFFQLSINADQLEALRLGTKPKDEITITMYPPEQQKKIWSVIV